MGPSGSGKTTTINILTGQLEADAGKASILGKPVNRLLPEDLAKFGLVTDSSGYYEKLTMYDNLLFYKRFYKVKQAVLDEILKRFGLYEHRNTLAEKLSIGMRQRMLLVRALIKNPKILFLDEPTSGLDPTMSRKIHQLLLQLKKSGTTIFLTTHDMQEASLLCDNLVLLNRGEIIEQGSPADLVKKYNRQKKIQVTYSDGSEKIFFLKDLSTIDHQDQIETLHTCEPTLEEIFLKLTGGKLSD
ncbi:Nod factor export ATP-binding protein I [Streptococcus troglodytae]|uniref:Nod factor export ATP-binding protein I n=1 Tax=Streptococcus troglodytae TaxID=1111760 RepID=A0A1L7LGI3_9STRE|nr:Nod factor export ATP-binding protein I [Streptococcus troglodytae]